jgi:Lon protease-like protein
MPLLPIFPLGTVLFPGGALPLHIFEDRYREMIAACVERDEPFGVVLIREGVEARGPAIPFEVGTTARITRVEKLADGRMNIVTIGGRRFRIRSRYESRPYLQAEVEYADRVEDADSDAAAAERVRELFSAHYRATLALNDQWTRRVDLPRRPSVLADFVGSRLDVTREAAKQEILEADSVAQCLRMEAALIERRLSIRQSEVAALYRRRHGNLGAMN